MKNIADILNEKIIIKKSPVVVGLDPVLSEIPYCYKEKYLKQDNAFEAISNVIFDFNKDVIDTVCTLVPAVKPQTAFYEMYGSFGFAAFEKTVKYAKAKGLIVIEDGKRNDIGNTAKAYASGHLGNVELIGGESVPSIDVDFLTVSPYLGSESLEPFIETCKTFNKGIFILVKTSNATSAEIQDLSYNNGVSVSHKIAKFIEKISNNYFIESGYSPIGAVVGATYPQQAKELREIMPRSIFLVPGYGAQGAKADDVLPCFNPDGLGAIVNSSRNILYSYKGFYENSSCTQSELIKSVKSATETMNNEIVNALRSRYKNSLKY